MTIYFFQIFFRSSLACVFRCSIYLCVLSTPTRTVTDGNKCIYFFFNKNTYANNINMLVNINSTYSINSTVQMCVKRIIRLGISKKKIA